MQLSPLIAVHATAAILAIATGPVALWARKGRLQRPKLHRAFGYAWVTLMLITAISAIFIKAGAGPSWNGFGIIHLLIPAVLFALFGATGLIQFLPSTARGLGTTTDALAGMSSVEQLNYVEKYFDPLLKLFDHAVSEGFVYPAHRTLVLEDSDPARLLDAIEHWKAPKIKRWIGEDET